MTDPGFATPPTVAGRVLDAQLDLLDRQILDPDGVPVTTVDDLELSQPEDLSRLDPDDAPTLTSLLTGPVLGTRIFGGRPPDSRFVRIPWSLVSGVGVTVEVGTAAENLDATWVERWVRDHIIGRIPGGRHDPQ
jgi:sporulation protein YlmC with PRC-barrel domain